MLRQPSVPARQPAVLLRGLLFALLGLCALGQATPAFSVSPNTLNVPGQYATIQAAINAANPGDTVLIADGTYTGPGNVDLDFGGRNDLTVRSVHGAAKTVINCGGTNTDDGSGDHRGFIFQNGETGAVISGLTIENGFESSRFNDPLNGPYAGNGGGIFISDSSVSIQDCLFTGNLSGTAGGGVFCDNGNPGLTATVTRCAFTNNFASFFTGNSSYSGAGGGLYGSNAGTMTVTDCTFTGNVSDDNAGNADGAGPGDGGGFYGSNSGTMILSGCTFTQNQSFYEGGLYGSNAGTMTLTGCTFADNSAVESVGGAGLRNSGTMNVTGCSFAGNVAGSQNGDGYGNGGGVGLSSAAGALTVTGCSFTGNTGLTGGGGAETSSSGGALTLTGCTFLSNVGRNGGPNGNGGGVENYTGPVTLTNCVLAGNSADFGGGVANDSGGTLTLTNCSLTGNSAYLSGGGVYNVGTANLTNDILYGDTAGDSSGEVLNDQNGTASATHCDIAGGLPPGTTDNGGNISADPKFVNPPADLHLRPGSPCLGAGTPNGAPTTTLDGYPRPDPPSIGAFELEPAYQVYVVNATSPAGQTVLLSAALTRHGGVGLAGATLTFTLDGRPAGSGVTNRNGDASVHYAVPPSLSQGRHTITASFSGDGTNPASSGAATLTVTAARRPNSVVTVGVRLGKAGTTVVLKATLKTPTGAALSGRTLSYTVDGVSAGSAVTDSTGLASLTYMIPAGTPAGSEPVVVSFSGDSGNAPSSGKGTLTVK